MQKILRVGIFKTTTKQPRGAVLMRETPCVHRELGFRHAHLALWRQRQRPRLEYIPPVDLVVGAKEGQLLEHGG